MKTSPYVLHRLTFSNGFDPLQNMRSQCTIPRRSHNFTNAGRSSTDGRVPSIGRHGGESPLKFRALLVKVKSLAKPLDRHSDPTKLLSRLARAKLGVSTTVTGLDTSVLVAAPEQGHPHYDRLGVHYVE